MNTIVGCIGILALLIIAALLAGLLIGIAASVIELFPL